MKQTRKQRRAENRRRHRALRRMYLANQVVTYDDLIARDRNPRRSPGRFRPHRATAVHGAGMDLLGKLQDAWRHGTRAEYERAKARYEREVGSVPWAYQKPRRNPKHDGSPTRGELKAARRAARTGDRHTYGERGGKRSASSAQYHRATSGSRTGSPQFSDRQGKLISLLGLLYFWESQDSDFWENLPDDPNGKRLMKAIWVVAKQQGISTKAALDAFKAHHLRSIMAAASANEEGADFEA